MTANLDHMRVFAALADAGSFTGAGRQLGVTKQTVSRRLRELEATLGVELVRRTTRRVTLTDVGVAYAARCADVVRLADEANRAVASHVDEVAGTLRISADHIVGQSFLPALVARYCAAQPLVRLEVILSSRKVDLIEEGYDVAFRVGAPPDVHHLAATRLGPATLWTVAAPAYLEDRARPGHPEELASHACVSTVPRPEMRGWPFDLDGQLALVPIEARVLTNGLAMARHAALAGVGVAHLPAFSVADDVRAGRLVRLLETFAPDVGGLHIVYPHSQLLAPKVRVFVDIAVRTLGDRAQLYTSQPKHH